MALPWSLQSLSFGVRFHQSVERVASPGIFHSLATEHVSIVAWSSGLAGQPALPALRSVFQTERGESGFAWQLAVLQLWIRVQRELAECGLAWQLAVLELRDALRQSLENVAFPGSFLSLSFGACLLCLSFGMCFNQSLENVALPGSGQSLRFGASF